MLSAETEDSSQMSSEVNNDILSAQIQSNGAKLIGRRFIGHMDNDPKHTAKAAQEFLKVKRWNILSISWSQHDWAAFHWLKPEEGVYIVLNMDVFLQKHMDSLQEAFIHPPESCEACFNMGGCALFDYFWTVELLYSKAGKSQDKDSSERRKLFRFLGELTL